jgi:hypothetical protein
MRTESAFGNGIIVAAVAFAVGLAYFVGNRLSNEAVAVVVGAVCGISASIPVSIGLVIATSNNWGRRDEPRDAQAGYDPGHLGDYGSHRYMPQPPVIIMSQPQSPMPYAPYAPYGVPQNQYMLPPSAPTMGAPREFKIIGDD